ncbi:MAG: Ppx/GppA phosphatase family protein [Actinomycetaceae bacterium]|nr:Ppx/GppA phosphatase family protein [Actinomycetaceae bacterium]MDY6083555.1 Ppx/GppA phosphatase family protein [Actinomycetaceae bacterium]
MARVAGVDCGTNSIRLLIADVPGRDGAALTDIVRRMEIVRLGEGVDRTGRFAPGALDRTFAVARTYGELCRHYHVESVRFAATSAARDASNREEFYAGIRAALGVDPQVFSGQMEARTSFAGAASALDLHSGETVMAIDLGGGSTELALGSMQDGQAHVQASYSMNVGSVRIHERDLPSDPPSASEVAAGRRDVRAALDDAEQVVDFSAVQTVVGLAGTVTSIAAKLLGLKAYNPDAVHGARLSLDALRAEANWFIHSTRTEREALGFLPAGRIDVIAAGALVLDEVLAHVSQRSHVESVVVSEHDILDGVALLAAQEPQPMLCDKVPGGEENK